MKKLRIGVLMGGKSLEREVSFNSGRTVCDHLDPHLYQVKPIFQDQDGQLYILPWKFLYRGKIADFQHRLHEAEQISWDDLKNHIDFVYITLHGRFAEDGTLQGMLEVLDIPYLGSKVYASAASMNKGIQKEILKANGIDVPKGIVVEPQDLERITLEDIIKNLAAIDVKLPLIIRPEAEGSSLGVQAIFNENDLIPAIVKAAYINPDKPQKVLVEEKLEGMEFCSVIITDPETKKPMPLPITEVIPEKESHFFDYEQKYMPGRSHQYTPARCSESDTQKIIDTCLKTMKALEVTNLIRTDGFLTKDGRVVILDPNTLTGMGPSTFLWRQAAHKNMTHSHLINQLIKTELASYQMIDGTETPLQGAKMAQKIKKFRIGVLLGGNSREKEISLESGRNIFYKLSTEKYEAQPIFVDSELKLHQINQRLLVCHSTEEIEHALEPEMAIGWHELHYRYDFIFIGLHGGHGENGAIQGTLEMLNMPYNGSGVLASSICMDKFRTNNFLKNQGFDVPENLLISKAEFRQDEIKTLQKITSTLKLPIIIKPHDDGCSVFVKKISSDKEIKNSLKELFENGKEYALVEEFIVGMELTVGVIGNQNPRVLPPSQAISQKEILSIEEKFLPGGGENQTPAPLLEEEILFVQEIIKNVYLMLGCKGYCRIDCFYQNEKQSFTGKKRLVIIEVNTLPGMTPATCLFHQTAEVGMKPMELIDTIIQLGFEEHSKITQTKQKSKKAKINISEGTTVYD